MSYVIGIIILYLLLGSFVRRILRPPDEDPPPEPMPQPSRLTPLFDVREMAAAAKQEADAAGELDGLLTDLQAASPRVVKVVSISWGDAEGEHSESIYCTGGPETDALRSIVYTQQCRHRAALSEITVQLSQRTRSVPNSVQNDWKRW